MSTIDEKLNEVLNIAEEVFEEKKEYKTLLLLLKILIQMLTLKLVEKTYTSYSQKATKQLTVFLTLAKEGEHPRAYEVAGQLIKTVSEVSQDLLGLQEKMKKLKDVPNTGPKSVTNALFVGSTTELTKLLKKKD